MDVARDNAVMKGRAHTPFLLAFGTSAVVFRGLAAAQEAPAAAPTTSAAPPATTAASSPPRTNGVQPPRPLPPQSNCGPGLVSVDAECIEKNRVVSPAGQRCEHVCMGGICANPGVCKRTPPPPSKTPYLHKDLYVRVGLGMGRATTDFKGWAAPAYEAAIGGAPSAGLNVGVGAYGALLPSLSDNELSALHGVGPFFDVYPDPSDGIHVQAALTYASLSIKADEYPSGTSSCNSQPCGPPATVERTDHGLGLVVGMGYEGWVSPETSVGIILRLQYFATPLGLHGPVGPGASNSLVIPAVLIATTLQ